jgi:hypothetical protein
MLSKIVVCPASSAFSSALAVLCKASPARRPSLLPSVQSVFHSIFIQGEAGQEAGQAAKLEGVAIQ